jgi:hypothetical protein
MVTARTTRDRVKRRLGVANIDSDIDDETIDEYIRHASAYIDQYTQKTTYDLKEDPVIESVATDLACVSVCLHMAGGKYYGGADYRIGPWTTTKSTGGRQFVELARQFRASAMQALKTVGNASFFRFAAG